MSQPHALGQRVTSITGLSTRDSWAGDLQKAIDQVGKRHAIPAEELVERLDRDTGLLVEVASFLTVGETYFLRLAAHFDLALAHVSTLLDSRPPDHKVRIWSAGCATGEEPYSMAILVRERVAAMYWSRVEVSGTDINRDAIAKAGLGVYGDWSFRRAPVWLRKRYFEPVDDRTVQLAASIRDSVHFHAAPLEEAARARTDAGTDIIFFRNVAIYLEPWALTRLFEAFHRVLAPDALLVMAPADPTPPAELFSRVSHGGGVYRKGASPTSRLPAPAVPPSVPPPARSAPPAPLAPPARTRSQSRIPLPKQPRPDAAPSSTQIAALLESEARQLAGRGDLPGAIDKITQALIIDAQNTAAWLLRGQLRLAARDCPQALSDLRRAVYLDGKDPLLRFWYATALVGSGQLDIARRQARAIRDQLAAVADGVLLGDQETTVAELRKAIQGMEGSP